MRYCCPSWTGIGAKKVLHDMFQKRIIILGCAVTTAFAGYKMREKQKAASVLTAHETLIGKRVCVIGGGPAGKVLFVPLSVTGLVSARWLLEAGLSPLVLERSGKVGGKVWSFPFNRIKGIGCSESKTLKMIKAVVTVLLGRLHSRTTYLSRATQCLTIIHNFPSGTKLQNIFKILQVTTFLAGTRLILIIVTKF